MQAFQQGNRDSGFGKPGFGKPGFGTSERERTSAADFGSGFRDPEAVPKPDFEAGLRARPKARTNVGLEPRLIEGTVDHDGEARAERPRLARGKGSDVGARTRGEGPA